MVLLPLKPTESVAKWRWGSGSQQRWMWSTTSGGRLQTAKCLLTLCVSQGHREIWHRAAHHNGTCRSDFGRRGRHIELPGPATTSVIRNPQSWNLLWHHTPSIVPLVAPFPCLQGFPLDAWSGPPLTGRGSFPWGLPRGMECIIAIAGSAGLPQRIFRLCAWAKETYPCWYYPSKAWLLRPYVRLLFEGKNDRKHIPSLPLSSCI